MDSESRALFIDTAHKSTSYFFFSETGDKQKCRDAKGGQAQSSKRMFSDSHYSPVSFKKNMSLVAAGHVCMHACFGTEMS